MKSWFFAGVVGLVVLISQNSFAGPIGWQYITESEFNAIVGDSANTVAFRGQMRVGDGNGSNYEVSLDEGGSPISYDSDFTWNLDGGPNAVQLVYSSGNGNLNLGVNSSIGSPTSLTVSPGEWYNTILISIAEGYPGDLTITGASVDGTSVGPLSTSSAAGYSYSAMMVTLPDNAEGDIQDLLFAGNLNASPLVGIGADDFRGTIYGMQVVPEPGSWALFLSALPILLFSLRRMSF